MFLEKLITKGSVLDCKTYRKMCRRKLKFLGDTLQSVALEFPLTHTSAQQNGIATPLTVNNLAAHNRLHEEIIEESSVDIGVGQVNTNHMTDQEVSNSHA